MRRTFLHSAPFPWGPYAGLAGFSSGRSSAAVSANPSANKRYSTPGSKYCPEDAPESGHAPGPSHFHTSFAVARARTHAGIHTVVSAAPTAGPLLSPVHPAACRTSTATARLHLQSPALASPCFRVRPFARTAAASGRPPHAIPSTRASTPPGRGSMPLRPTLPSDPGISLAPRWNTTSLFRSLPPAKPALAPALFAPSDLPEQKELAQEIGRAH